ncbi:hypothetical protein C731_1967 [Mycolicibacterium hassiacum DSM 44199]|uniref:Uncharacterized protein n=2 Tax=Mycolicibacterium hassiacum TaxID=46351 RepID=K5BGH3_MYCHD|nr:hypothetical protein [Mycolicibacterium hassiacum]EKF24036.1 hypothetical protein C731_1967 [Mycolicibacterium hassiacum DSM 44199]MDA4086284.1 hypothetical protein [Mycolicibacterium hassiacum DSM 44199]VCT90769.1 hypothetical protein MHAS_02478 [Mycolicibacterium hassiacum DSM 44199]
MTVRPDNRLLDEPMRPVDCTTCGASVLVRKASWEQTSVQWTAQARRQCRHRPHPGGHAVALCPQLRSAIEDAVRQGRLPVLADREAVGGSGASG